MSVKTKLGRAAGIAVAAIGLSALGLAGVASASTAQPAAINGPQSCSIQTTNGHYLTAVGGGGRTTDVIHSNATWLQAWEKFTFNSLGGGYYDIQVDDGHYLTAVNGGGLNSGDTLHTNATHVGSWETFRVTCGL